MLLLGEGLGEAACDAPDVAVEAGIIYAVLIKEVSKAFPRKTTTISVPSTVTSSAGALRAGLIARAEDWRWGSLWRPVQKIEPDAKLLSPRPLAQLPNWVARVSEPHFEQELDAVPRCLRRGSPLGDASWVKTTAHRLALPSTHRPRGRPRVRPAQKTQNISYSPFILLYPNEHSWTYFSDAAENNPARTFERTFAKCRVLIGFCVHKGAGSNPIRFRSSSQRTRKQLSSNQYEMAHPPFPGDREMAEKKRYVVTFVEEEFDSSEAAKVLNVQKKSIRDGFEALGLAEDVDEDETLHFEDLGASVVTLDEDEVEGLRDDNRVAAVEADIEVEAHGGCGCEGSAGSGGGQPLTEISAPDSLDPFSAGYQQAISDLVGQLGYGSCAAESEIITPQAGRCPPGSREVCFRIFGRRFCFCVPGGPPVSPPSPPAQRQPIPWNIELVQANRVWQRVTGAGVKVAIIDTGIDNDHPDLSVAGGASFVPGVSDWDDDQGHGTHCAGIAGARHNAIGIVGVAPGCSLYAVKVMRPVPGGASGRLSWILAGMGWAARNGMEVASMSLGSCVAAADAACTVIYQRAAERLIQRGCIVISSAGNSGRCPDPPRAGVCQPDPDFPPCGPWVGRPARCPGFMAVAAVDRNRNLANFSSRGPAGLGSDQGVEISAPGVSVRSTIPGGGYGSKSGTSMACPHVAGAAALLKELHPSWTPSRIRARLRATADDLGVPGNDPGTGSGLLNCHRAVFG